MEKIEEIALNSKRKNEIFSLFSDSSMNTWAFWFISIQCLH